MSDPEIAAFFDRFVADFASFDGGVIATRYAVPYLAIGADGGRRLFEDTPAVAAYFQMVLDGYAAAGVRSCRYHSLDIVHVGARSALATVTWEMLGEAGDMRSSWRESYNLLRTGEGLRVAVSTDHPA